MLEYRSKLDADGRRIVTCKLCGFERLTHWPKEQVRHVCKAPVESCVYRRQETRREKCESCGGHVEIKVFACAIHGECTISNPVDRAACCLTCHDFSNAPNLAAPAESKATAPQF